MTRPARHIAAPMATRKSLFARRRRGSVSIEAILAFPVLLVLFGGVAQVMLLAQSRLYVEQAAYAAARSALAHKCPPFDPIFAAKYPISAAAMATCRDADHAHNWKNAASWALVAAAPSSDRGCTDHPQAAVEIFEATNPQRNLTPALKNRLCYAFDDNNFAVTVEWMDTVKWPVTGNTEVPVAFARAKPIKATVKFKYPLTTPFRRFISDEKEGDHYYRWGEATVVLL